MANISKHSSFASYFLDLAIDRITGSIEDGGDSIPVNGLFALFIRIVNESFKHSQQSKRPEMPLWQPVTNKHTTSQSYILLLRKSISIFRLTQPRHFYAFIQQPRIIHFFYL
ncbi:hypothetical protein LOAG_00937 [Loa loa]|uniref:Uncharacterized protein n=1 Tax=Loa loa TaxID=7209 RepID=A0A1S0UAV7_LOALO|nr:hypothetical protein LOAG_00937 [Loa loa]EFO27539.1 hypothetical protein LOAG_00937 [Loa loa]